MNNQEILDKRWKKTDKALKSAYDKSREIYNRLNEDLLDDLNILSYKHSDLSKQVSVTLKRKVNRKMRELDRYKWSNFYLMYLLMTMDYTLKKVLSLYIYDSYRRYLDEIKKISYDAFITSANDIHKQASEDIGKKLKPLKNEQIIEMAKLPALDQTFEEHIDTMAITQAQETENYILSITMTDDEVTEELLNKKLIVQNHRLIDVRDNKFSGTITDEIRIVANTAYITLLTADNEKKEKVLFIAEIDERTTEMCKSLDGQEFWINDWNEFDRYSDAEKTYKHYRIFGLQIGVNLPPITDHFHWCRSTIIYI